MVNLKPCPFCGEADELYENYDAGVHTKVEHRVLCVGCGFEFLIERWNSRPVEDSIMAKIEAIIPLANLGLARLNIGPDTEAVMLGLLDKVGDTSKVVTFEGLKKCYRETPLATAAREALATLGAEKTWR